MSKIRMILAMIVVAFFIYCGESATNRSHSDRAASSFVKESQAQTLPARTTIYDQQFHTVPASDSNDWCVTPTWDITAYKQVVVHVGQLDASSHGMEVQQKYGVAGFAAVQYLNTPPWSAFIVDPVNGTSLRVASPRGLAPSGSPPACDTLNVTVVGISP